MIEEKRPKRAMPGGYFAYKGDRKTNDGKDEDFTAAPPLSPGCCPHQHRLKLGQSHSLKVLNEPQWDYIFPLDWYITCVRLVFEAVAATVEHTKWYRVFGVN